METTAHSYGTHEAQRLAQEQSGQAAAALKAGNSSGGGKGYEEELSAAPVPGPSPRTLTASTP